MIQMARSDDELLASRDPGSFEQFYRGHVDAILAFFAHRTRDAELAADLTAETFAAALAGRRRYRRKAGAADSWLFGIAYHKLADAQRRGGAGDSAPPGPGGWPVVSGRRASRRAGTRGG